MAHELAVLETEDEKLRVEAQFNPETLEIRYVVDETDESNGSTNTSDTEQSQKAKQRTGYRIELSGLQLLFDTTRTGEDVRQQTLQIAKMLHQEGNAAPQVRFRWGSLMFKGTIDGITETLEYFSEAGIPLRAQVALEMAMVPDEKAENDPDSQASGASAGLSAGIDASTGISTRATPNTSGRGVGTTPLTLASAGESIQNMADAAGLDWKAVAEANNIDNPRDLQPGSVLNLNLPGR